MTAPTLQDSEPDFKSGEDALDVAVRLAKARPILLHAPLSGFGPLFRDVMSVAYWLQKRNGSLNILLPVERLGEAFGVPALRISVVTGIATDRGLLDPEDGRRWKPGRLKHWYFNLTSPLYTAPHAEEGEAP